MTTKAPDGAAWPVPWIAVDTAEQRPFTFGACPLVEDDRSRVGANVGDPKSLVTTLLNGPFGAKRANLHTADYWLLGPDADGNVGPVDGEIGVERKGFGDLCGSLTAGHDRFIAEMDRLAPFKTPLVIVEGPIEALLGARSELVEALDLALSLLSDRMSHDGDDAWRTVRRLTGWLAGKTAAEEDRKRRNEHKARSMIGTCLSIMVDRRIPILFLPSRAWAEYAAAWCLRRAWRRWLVEDASGSRLRFVREGESAARMAAEEAARSGGTSAADVPAPRMVIGGGLAVPVGEALRRREAKRRGARGAAA